MAEMKKEKIVPADIAASFQNAVVDTLLTHAMMAVKEVA